MSVLRIAALGDVMCGESFHQYGVGTRAKIARFGHSFLPRPTVDLLHGHDLVIANVEGVLSDVAYRPTSLRSHNLRGAPASAALLRGWGITCASVANNHILDHSLPAAIDTVRHLSAQGLVVIGAGTNDCFRAPGHSTIIRCRDRSIGLVAACLLHDAHSFSGGFSRHDVISECRSLARRCDVVIVSLHWGVEYMPYPDGDQRDFARALSGAGASLVLGHHPHVPQGVERLGDSVIAYSLGNFISDQLFPDSRWSYILSVTCHASGVIHALHPFRLNEHHAPVLMSDNGREALIDELTSRSRLVTAWRDDASYHRQAGRAARRARVFRLHNVLRRLRAYPMLYLAQLIARPLLRRVGVR